MDERIDAKVAHVAVLMFLDNGECRAVIKPEQFTEKEFIKNVCNASASTEKEIKLSSGTFDMKWRENANG